MENKNPEENEPKGFRPSEEHRRKMKKKMEESAEGEKFDKEGNMFVKLTIEDSALIVRADGTIEMISHDLEKAPDGYVGDVEDLNKTFSLVLALASALENEDLYNRIYHNLNMTLMNKWQDIPEDVKAEIVERRRNEALNRSEEERKEKNRRVEEFRRRMNKYKDQFLDEERRRLNEDMQRESEFLESLQGDFDDPQNVQDHMDNMPDPREYDGAAEEFLAHKKDKKKIKKVKRNPLGSLRNVDWNPYDESLKSHGFDWRADEPPADEDDE